MQIWKDGIYADRNAKDYKMETMAVNKQSKVKISMTTGGGWVAIISKK
jgi:alpha-glucosidase